MTNVQVLLLAAGSSSRMGSPKQLLPWGYEVVIVHQIQNLLKTNLDVTVVLGANATLVETKIKDLNVEILHHSNWENGMGSSISCGVKKIDSDEKSYEGILITLVDQPFITTEHYKNMLAIFQPGKKQIIVSESLDGIWSPPILFDKMYLQELIKLEGETGAKKIITQHKKNVVLVKFQSSLEDMDTPESYEKMLRFFERNKI